MKWSLNLACVVVLGASACSGAPTAPAMPIDNALPGAAAGVAALPANSVPTTPGAASPIGSTPQPTAAAGNNGTKPAATAGTGAAPPNMPTVPANTTPDTCPTCEISAECRGFSFDCL